MKCEDALLLISGHLDHSNTEAEETRLQSHLSQCPACRSLMDTLREADAGILSLEEEAPASLCQNVMDAIAREAPARKRQRRAWITTAAAAFILAAGIGALALPGMQTKQAASEADQAFATTSRMAPEESAAGQSAAKDAAPYTAYSAASNDWMAQDLADERQADVALVTELLPELDGCVYERLTDGGLLYTLAAADSAADLCRAHPNFAVLFQPEEVASEVSYALLLP